jgi:Protein of unknown function DUF262/Protein of unknown function (DUF1524)
MTYGLQARVTTLAKLLRPPRVFDVPAFQRAYSWTVHEAGQLLEDLLLAISEADAQGTDAGYFLGPILLLRNGADGDPQAPAAHDGPATRDHQIIDGQQRLATLTVLACVLRDLARETDPDALPYLDAMIRCSTESGERPRWRLQMRGAAQGTMAALIQTPGATLIESGADGPREGGTEAEALLLAVRDHFIELLSDRDQPALERIAAFIAHECEIAVITSGDVDRAHRTFAVLNSRGRPLNRSNIINALLMDDVAGGELSRLQGEWEQLSHQLAGDFDALFSHVHAAIGDPRLPIIADIQRLAKLAGGGGNFNERVLLPFGRAFATLTAASHSGSPLSDEINRRLRHLSWLSSAEWIPPVLLWWTRNPDQPEQLSAFLCQMDRLAYGMRILGLGGDKRLARMYQVRTAVEKGTALDSDGGPFEFTGEEVRNIRYNLRDLHRRSQPTCKLILLRLDSELSGGARRFADADLTVEHILPQNPGRNSRWRDWFTDAEERRACTASLGNLVLMPRTLNAAARNQDYDRKLAIFFSAGGPPLPQLTEELRGLTAWTPLQVRAREERLLSILDRMWHLGKAASGAAGLDGAEPPKRRRARKQQAAK